MSGTIVLTLVAVLLATVIIAGVWLAIVIRKSRPQISGKIEFPGLENPVEVSRDVYGIPHIKAQSELDLYSALGFVNAQDRLWQLDVFRRLSQGRMAEILGPDLIPLDHRHRVFGFQRLAEKLYTEADESSRAICQAYVMALTST